MCLEACQALKEEERLWTQLIEKYGSSDAIWKADVVGRAYGNRGNARSRQGKMEDALSDFGEAIALCPWSVDPLLNRSSICLRPVCFGLLHYYELSDPA